MMDSELGFRTYGGRLWMPVETGNRIRKPMLYPLSYRGTDAILGSMRAVVEHAGRP